MVVEDAVGDLDGVILLVGLRVEEIVMVVGVELGVFVGFFSAVAAVVGFGDGF